MAEELSFKELAELESGTILEDGYENEVRYIIMRGPSALCAYVGLPIGHPLAGMNYNDLPLDCHGGLTFGKEGEGEDSFRPRGLFWYGWDYGHSGDRAFYYEDDYFKDDKEWTVPMVKREIWHVTYTFKQLMDLVESVTHDTMDRMIWKGSSVAAKDSPEK